MSKATPSTHPRLRGREAFRRREASAEPKPSGRPSDAPLMEFHFPDVHDPHWIREVRAKWGARVRLKICRSFGKHREKLLQVAEVTASRDAIPAIERYLRNGSRFEQIHVVRLSPSKLFVREVEPSPPLCALVHGSGAFCSNCRFLTGTTEEPRPWVVVVPRGTDARPILRALPKEEHGAAGAGWQVRRYRPARGLTARQSDALGVAHRLGFYSFPRRGRLADVARALEINRSTAAELLRRAEAKVVAEAVSD